MDRHHQPAPLRKIPRQQRDRGRVPNIVADADERRADQQHPVAVGKAHGEVGQPDPGERQRHQQALARNRIHRHAAGDVGQRSGGKLDRQDRADLAEAQPKVAADQRQQQVERRWVPMRHQVAGGDQPHLTEAGGRCRLGRDARHDPSRDRGRPARSGPRSQSVKAGETPAVRPANPGRARRPRSGDASRRS